MAKIRHVALMTENVSELADFYKGTFGMKEVHRGQMREDGIQAIYLSDGYINLAILPQSPKGEIPVGLNHFGFHVENVDNIKDKLVAEGMEEPIMRPAGRYAEFRGSDLYGTMFDLSENGFQEDDATRAKREAAKKIEQTDI